MKLIYKLCYWILSFQKKPMYVRVPSERVKVVTYSENFSNYYIRQYGSSFIEKQFLERTISKLASRGLILIKRFPADKGVHPNMAGAFTRYETSIKIILDSLNEIEK